jgi:O-methyltransferase
MMVGNVNVEHLLLDRAVRELYQPSPAGTIFPRGQKTKVYDIAAHTIGGGPVTYLEFGVHRGWSMHHISGLFRDPGATFVGFDSFEGLPETWGPFKPGHFSTDGTAPSTTDSRVKFVRGWFQNSVPEFLQANRFNGPLLIHFDADLYTSTLFLMTALWHHIPDYYFLFDEFVPSEIMAMYDFARVYPVAFEFTACTVDERGRPIQIFGRLRNAVYRPTFLR